MTLVNEARLLDSPPEEAFDRLTRLASRLLGAPIALVTLAEEDRVFFKSSLGVPEPWASLRGSPPAFSFCRHVVASGAPLIVEDARRHPLLRSSPAIRTLGWIAYAGVPLTTPDGATVGALCVIDAMPRIWSPRDVAFLEDLAVSVVSEIELRTPRHDERSAGIAAGTLPPHDPAAAVFDVSALPMGLVLPDGRWLRVNRALADLVRTTPSALEGCRADAITHPADRSADEEASRLLRAGECASYSAEKRLLRGGEEPVWVIATVTIVPGSGNGPAHVHVAFHDITDRKRSEDSLRTREARYRLVSELNSDAVWDWDLLTDRISWDERPEGVFGYHRTPAGLSAAWWYERLHADDRERVVSGIHAAIATGAGRWTEDYRFRRAGGGYAHVRDRAAILRDDAGDATRMVGAVTDTTEYARTELLAAGQRGLLE